MNRQQLFEALTENDVKEAIKDDSQIYYDMCQSIFEGSFTSSDRQAFKCIAENLSKEAKACLNRAKSSAALSVLSAQAIFPPTSILPLLDADIDLQDFCSHDDELNNYLNGVLPDKDFTEEFLEEEIKEEMILADGGCGLEEGDGAIEQSDGGMADYLYVRNNKNIADIAKYAGKYIEALNSLKRQEPIKNNTEPCGYYLSDDLAQALPDELALMDLSEESELLFYKKFVEQNLMCQDYFNKSTTGFGPVAFFLDVSTSMTVNDSWKMASAIAAALSYQIKKSKQKREIHLYTFGNYTNFYDLTDLSQTQVMRTVNIMPTQGATILSDALFKFMDKLKKQDLSEKRPDAIIITDGIVDINYNHEQIIRPFKEETGLNILSLYIKHHQYPSYADNHYLKLISDYFFDTGKLMDSSKNVAQMLQKATTP